MSEQYVQRVEVPLRPGARRDQILGVVLQLIGLGMIAVAVFYNWYAFIAVAAFLGAGIWLTQKFYGTARQYEYDYSTERLVVSRTNIVNRRKRILEIVFDDVTFFTYFRDTAFDDDIVAADDLHSEEIKAMGFKADGKNLRLLFRPDDYLTALLSERLKAVGKKRKETAAAAAADGENDDDIS